MSKVNASALLICDAGGSILRASGYVSAYLRTPLTARMNIEQALPVGLARVIRLSMKRCLGQMAKQSGAYTTHDHPIITYAISRLGNDQFTILLQGKMVSRLMPNSRLLNTDPEPFSEAQRDKRQRVLLQFFQQSAEAMLILDTEGHIEYCNMTFANSFGCSQNDLCGLPLLEVVAQGQNSPLPANLLRLIDVHGGWQCEVLMHRPDGTSFPAWLSIESVVDRLMSRQYYIATFSDISALKTSQARAEFLSRHDPLTSLPNRTTFHEELAQALARARQNTSKVAVLFLDVDNFKLVNDRLGHMIGDEMLRIIAGRLRKTLRPHQIAARLGGDEFAILTPIIDVEEGHTLAQNILKCLNDGIKLQGQSCDVSISIGSAFFPQDGEDVGSLLQAADGAMYQAKELGRNRYQVFEPGLRARIQRRGMIEAALRQAYVHEQFALRFQPIYDCTRTPQAIGAEALLRWNDPLLGVMHPGEFIPIAERAGLIQEVDHHVHQMVLHQIRDWHARGLSPMPISVNVSPHSLREVGFADTFLSHNQAAGVSSHSLRIEITETALLENSPVVSANLQRLHGAGIRIAVDDFGSGYSSLSYLTRLPLDQLKIDKGFIHGLETSKECETVTRAILSLASALNLSVTAEGVETQAHLDWLRKEGCFNAQGFLFSHPLNPKALEALMSDRVEPYQIRAPRLLGLSSVGEATL